MLGRFSTVVDIGAGTGQFAAWADAELRPSIIHCIEPRAGALLGHVTQRTDAHVQIHPIALGAEIGSGLLHVTAAPDSSSLLQPTPTAAKANPHLRVRERTDVPVTTGDALLSGEALMPPVLVKIDVQGTEDAVLRGMPEVLSRTDAVLVEVGVGPTYEGQSSFTEVVCRLGRLGFRTHAFAPVPGASAQLELLFRRG
jgi:FkbM family methyltransferase